MFGKDQDKYNSNSKVIQLCNKVKILQVCLLKDVKLEQIWAPDCNIEKAVVFSDRKSVII